MQTEKRPPFKVLIAGGSIAGLTLANALARANIDFLLLESHSRIDASIGGALTIVSNGLRILDQMGIYDDISKYLEPTGDIYTYLKDGRLLGKMDTPRVMQKRHFYPVAWLPREQLLRILYEHVPDKNKVLVNKRILSVDHSDEGVVVRCEDGSEYAGSMIAGADGIHSTIRGEMWRYMEESKKWKIKAKKDRKAMTAEYACILGISRPTEGLKPGEIHRTWGKGFTTFVNVGKGNQVFWFIFTKMDRNFQYPGVPKFTREELDARVKTFLDTHVGAGIKFESVYENVTTSAFVPLEEGTCQGASLAIEDAASLANHIVSMVNSTSGMPSSVDITETLPKWAAGLRPRAKAICDAGATFTRLEALANWPLKFAALYISPHIGGVFADLVSVCDIGAPRLNFLALPEREDDSVATEKGAKERKWKGIT
ncbi:FAD/NAD(P)-binding domain-containing protein [Penicillium cinerascens]|uniref:FAD/NAD(P)-binding domain-containing protein n=1 Tax=Penicillium cinerascens TaxID=70096 RepID=A0A9W9M5Q7_9EURO|nr:FAD/NAD(P)-binding domain-containing protein [Penicillium cinerascens]KAJ5190255.1 FAD/NAD(P)-binding domain-containing protein [Penicillium cinerascens]